MDDKKVAVTVGFAACTSCALFMIFEYLIGLSFILESDNVDNLIPHNFITEFAYDLLNGNWFYVRASFVVFGSLMYIASGHSDMVGDWMSKKPNAKITFTVIFFISSFLLLFIGRIPMELSGLFVVLYPSALFGFLSTGIVLPQYLKKEKKLMDIEFGFQKQMEATIPKGAFHWHSDTDGFVVVVNPKRGIAIIGGAGSGKSYTLIEPIIDQAIVQNYTGLVYDFKFPTLTKYLYRSFVNSGSTPAVRDKDGKWTHPQSLLHDRRKVWFVSFRDIRYSHRVNPIAPEYMLTQSYATEFATTLLYNLKKEWIKSRDFFADSAIIYLKAIFWYLKKNKPEYCTIPHAIVMALQDYRYTLTALSMDDDTAEIIQPLLVAEKKNASEQIAGAVASLQNPIDILNSPEIFWVLSGNNFSLELNNPENPSFLCLGNDPQLKNTYGPVAALIATVVKQVINKQGQMDSIYCLDEAPTLFVDLADLPATGRSNGIVTIVCIQDQTQLIDMYGKEKAEVLMANLGNIFCGQVNHLETAKMFSEVIGSRDKENLSFNKGKNMGGDSLSKSSGENSSTQKEALIHPYQIMSLPQGEFVGKLAETLPGADYFFKMKPTIVKNNTEHAFQAVLRDNKGEVLTEEVANNMMRKQRELIKHEMKTYISIVCRAAVLLNKADEDALFPGNHYMREGKKTRIVNIDGTIQRYVKGITVNDYGEVSGTPQFID